MEKNVKKKDRCERYVGITCVNGNCPIALAEEHEEYYSEIKNCDDCCYYKGCEDCALYKSKYCIEA